MWSVLVDGFCRCNRSPRWVWFMSSSITRRFTWCTRSITRRNSWSHSSALSFGDFKCLLKTPRTRLEEDPHIYFLRRFHRVKCFSDYIVPDVYNSVNPLFAFIFSNIFSLCKLYLLLKPLLQHIFGIVDLQRTIYQRTRWPKSPIPHHNFLRTKNKQASGYAYKYDKRQWFMCFGQFPTLPKKSGFGG